MSANTRCSQRNSTRKMRSTPTPPLKNWGRAWRRSSSVLRRPTHDYTYGGQLWFKFLIAVGAVPERAVNAPSSAPGVAARGVASAPPSPILRPASKQGGCPAMCPALRPHRPPCRSMAPGLLRTPPKPATSSLSKTLTLGPSRRPFALTLLTLFDRELRNLHRMVLDDSRRFGSRNAWRRPGYCAQPV